MTISKHGQDKLTERKIDLSLLLSFVHTDNDDMFGHLLVNDSPELKYFFQAEISS